MNIIILCAGMGKRFHSRKPKCLTKVFNKPIIDYTRNSITKEINWDDYYWGIAYDENTIKEAREGAMEYCNETDKKANDECIILIENNKVVLNITKTSGYCFNGLEKMVGLKPPKRIENILREDCAVHSF